MVLVAPCLNSSFCRVIERKPSPTEKSEPVISIARLTTFTISGCKPFNRSSDFADNLKLPVDSTGLLSSLTTSLSLCALQCIAASAIA